MSMNNEARNLRLSDSSLFPTKRARLAGAHVSRTTHIHAYTDTYMRIISRYDVCARGYTRLRIPFVWVARTF